MAEFSPIQQSMLGLLSDGKRHPKEELLALCDELSTMAAVHQHVSQIRKKLPPSEDIVCVYSNRRTHYQHVRKLYSPYDGLT